MNIGQRKSQAVCDIGYSRNDCHSAKKETELLLSERQDKFLHGDLVHAVFRAMFLFSRWGT